MLPFEGVENTSQPDNNTTEVSGESQHQTPATPAPTPAPTPEPTPEQPKEVDNDFSFQDRNWGEFGEKMEKILKEHKISREIALSIADTLQDAATAGKDRVYDEVIKLEIEKQQAAKHEAHLNWVSNTFKSEEEYSATVDYAKKLIADAKVPEEELPKLLNDRGFLRYAQTQRTAIREAVPNISARRKHLDEFAESMKKSLRIIY